MNIYCGIESKKNFEKIITQYYNNLPNFLKNNKQKIIMKKIKCLDNNGYNITVGKTYNLLQESQDFYFLVNDNNKTVKYGRGMFELVNEEQPVQVQPELPKQLSEAEMIASIAYQDGEIYFDNVDGEQQVIDIHFAYADTDISCGINQTYQIDDIIDDINNIVDAFENDDYIELRKAIFKKAIEEKVIKQGNVAMTILSTTSDKDDDLLSVLDEMADLVTASIKNPNTQNDIKMWVFYTN